MTEKGNRSSKGDMGRIVTAGGGQERGLTPRGTCILGWLKVVMVGSLKVGVDQLELHFRELSETAWKVSLRVPSQGRANKIEEELMGNVIHQNVLVPLLWQRLTPPPVTLAYHKGTSPNLNIFTFNPAPCF